jgi:molybdopterin-guanine dinucleotide biosynthesis protein A
MNGFILAGGKSTRMGRDKALLEWQGRPLIEHALAKLHSVGISARILGVRPDLAGFAPVISDNFPEQGPLGGIEAALSATDTDLNLFLPIDLPLLPVEFLNWMVARAELTQAAATIPRIEGQPQPLCAIYHRGLRGGIQSALSRGDRKVMRVVGRAADDAGMVIDIFDIEAVAAVQSANGAWPWRLPMRRWFENLNSPGDVVRTAVEQTPLIL